MHKKYIFFLSLILLASLFLCSCSSETVETAPADSTPPFAEQQADTSPQVDDEPQLTDEPQADAGSQIPDDYLSYMDEAGIFSISYPSEWELLLNLINISEQEERDIINSINENRPVEKASTVFLAGLPFQKGYSPNAVMVIEPLVDNTWGIDEACEFEINAIKMEVREYNEISRDKTVIDGKEAIVLHYEAKTQNSVMLYTMHMLITVDKNIWMVVCGASSDSEYSKWEDDFNSIVRSLRILK